LILGCAGCGGASGEAVRRSYQAHISNYLGPLLGGIPPSKLRAEHIAGMPATIRDATPRSRSSAPRAGRGFT
jgi:hypothetical protein